MAGLKIEPCPHCLSRLTRVSWVEGEDMTWLSIECSKCGAYGPLAATHAEAIRMWNEYCISERRKRWRE